MFKKNSSLKNFAVPVYFKGVLQQGIMTHTVEVETGTFEFRDSLAYTNSRLGRAKN